MSDVAQDGGGIACPDCGSYESLVVDSRATTSGRRRRRVCGVCKVAFTTIETVAGPQQNAADEALLRVCLSEVLTALVKSGDYDIAIRAGKGKPSKSRRLAKPQILELVRSIIRKTEVAA